MDAGWLDLFGPVPYLFTYRGVFAFTALTINLIRSPGSHLPGLFAVWSLQMNRIKRVKLATVALLVLVGAGCRRAKAETIEKALMVPPVTYAGATFFGVPVTSATQWLMFLYALSMLGWHIKSKWLAKKPEVTE